jgi:hypothetical protein
MSRKRAISLFQTKVFKTALVAFLSGLAPILIRCAYAHKGMSLEDALTVAALSSTLATTLVGRMDTNPVYTPDGLPGANKGDFQ